jgi:hypothetical protein
MIKLAGLITVAKVLEREDFAKRMKEAAQMFRQLHRCY